MDQVWHPPIDPAPRGAVGLARIYADAYGKLQSGRCDVGQFGRCDSGHASSLVIRMTSLTITGVLVCSKSHARTAYPALIGPLKRIPSARGGLALSPDDP